MDAKRGIGKRNRLSWSLKADLVHFQKITKTRKDPETPNVVLMGRKTWESLPEARRPLPGRLNVVLTRDAGYALPQEVLRAASLDDALARLAQKRIGEVFVIGGAQVFAEAFDRPECVQILVTEVAGDFKCDVFLPEFPSTFQRTEESEEMAEGDIRYRFVIYRRI